MDKVGIIIVNYNGANYLSECINALQRQTYTNNEILVVDNNSQDSSLELLKSKFPEVKLIKSSENSGFSKGNNLGFRYFLTNPEINYFAIINNDTIPDENWLEESMNAIDLENKVHMIASIATFTEKYIIQNAGLIHSPFVFVFGKGGNSKYFDKNINIVAGDEEVFAPSGVSALYTRELLESVGLFDEDLFMYYEDYDLGWRAQRKGYRARLASKSRLVHLHSVSAGGAASPFKAYYVKRNVYLVTIKNGNILQILMLPFVDLVWNLFSILKKDSSASKLRGNSGGSKLLNTALKAYIDVVKLSTKFLLKRIKNGNNNNS